MKQATTATESTAFGLNSLGGAAGAATTGGYNSAFGHQALQVVTTGSLNTALGRNSLAALTTGSYNIAVGGDTLQNMTTASTNTAVGYNAGNAITSGDNCAIVGTNALKLNTTGNHHTVMGSDAGNAVTTGVDNTLIGSNAGTNITTGSQITAIGRLAKPSAAGTNREIILGYNLTGQGSAYVTIGADNGKIYNSFTANATWTQTSDGRMKKNIQDDTLGLSFINRLRPVKFNWKGSNELETTNPYYADENKRDTTTVIHGLIAQEVKAALDAEGVDTFAGWDVGPDGIQAISREMFISPLIKAIQEQQALITSLTARIAALET
jgi:hypothetical protein